MKPMSKTLIAFLLAAVAFSLLFTGIVFNFWAQMSLSVATLCVLAFLFDREGMRDLFRLREQKLISVVCLGLFSALILYFVFFVGNIAARRILMHSKDGIAAVYDLKHGANPWLIAVLITLIIAPGEEIFWRGYLQRKWEQRYGRFGVIMAAVAYGVVHVPSGNIMLIIASIVCGVFWSLSFWRFRSIWLNIVSHVAWDLSVFLIWPFLA